MKFATSNPPARTMIRPPKSLVWASVLVGVSLASGASLGQNLAKLPGLTDLQQPTASAVNTVCVKFGARSALNPSDTTLQPNSNGSQEQRLYYSCRAMVQTANQINPVPGTSPPIGASLNITNDQLRTGVQAVSPVQMNAQKQMSTEASKMNLLGGRLLDLRGGARGFVVARDDNGTQQTVAGSQARTLDGATGGAAAADDLGGGKWGGFFNVGYAWGNVDQTSLQDGYDYSSVNLLVGADYRVSDAFVLGGAISYSNTKSNYDQSLGNVKADTTGVALYGTYYVDRWYVDGFAAYGHVNYDSTRNIYIPSNSTTNPPINASATASPKGDQWSFSIGAGRNYDWESAIVTPFARLGYIYVKNEAFSENEPINGLGLAVSQRSIQSLQSALGAKVSGNVNTSSGVFGPYFSAQWMHEFLGGSTSIVSKYVSDPFNTIFTIPTAGPTRDYAVLSLGSSATFPNNFSGFLQFSAAVGLQNESNYGVTLGLRKQF
jgi:uncharacterized protein YhjY with autotransporter beta-barrel domain